MTDRELLELAANAAGIEYEWHYGCGDALHLTAPDATAIYWNPLEDDGDALRLAVKLEMLTNYDMDSIVAMVLFDSTDQDPYAATRRAIVRAAAEIGKAMP